MDNLNVKVLHFPTSQDAWEGINEAFIRADEKLFGKNNDKGGSATTSAAYCYNVTTFIRRAELDPNFDFGKLFGYRAQKWTLLVNNYVNLNKLDIMRSQVRGFESRRSRNYNFSFLFDNTHGNGKGCLIAASFCRRVDLDIPILIANMRSSEITKRLAFDLLLLERLGNYVWGTPFIIQLNCNQMYCNEETIIMYNTHKPFKKILKGVEKKQWTEAIYKKLRKFKKLTEKDITYKVYLRTLRQIRPELFHGHYKPLFAKDLLLIDDDIPYPETCISMSQRQKFKKRYLYNLKRSKKDENLH